ncbi:peptide deformylase [Streptomyces sulphureus]|uniref:peptide deformylase n=1 Tax=Streptomyces sulphureus TaxID=47758 RepID=UPI0003602D54|nr:peptide deformylase [Streptomyces sulphureus]
MQRGPIPGGSGAVRPLLLHPDPLLRATSREATAEDGPLAPLAEDMYASMYAANGVGLAACQIGVPLRLFVYDCPDDEERRHRGALVNPRLVEADGPTVRGPEGCLSLPGLESSTPRPDHAVVEGYDLAGASVRVVATGFFARCLQHELDHLDGGLYLDRLSGIRRRLAVRRAGRRPWLRRAGARVR